MNEQLIRVSGLSKTFILHTQGGVRIPVFSHVDLAVGAGECVVLDGPSGSGKSTLLRSLYANYKPTSGSIQVRHDGQWFDLVDAMPRLVVEIRRRTVGYVSQFLRVIPRVPTLDIVASAATNKMVTTADSTESAVSILRRLNLPERLWRLPPATFSGGEQQRVNIARCFVRRYPILLLDEPTASLDVVNRQVVVELIQEAKASGTAVIGIFHDEEVRNAVATRRFEVAMYKPSASLVTGAQNGTADQSDEGQAAG